MPSRAFRCVRDVRADHINHHHHIDTHGGAPRDWLWCARSQFTVGSTNMNILVDMGPNPFGVLGRSIERSKGICILDGLKICTSDCTHEGPLAAGFTYFQFGSYRAGVTAQFAQSSGDGYLDPASAQWSVWAQIWSQLRVPR